MTYNTLDLFCGAGGLSYGFKLAGFHIYDGIELDKSSLTTYSLNFELEDFSPINITQITNNQIIDKYSGKIAVVIGGPPCQGFSCANRSSSINSTVNKNLLFYEFLRFIKLIKPKIFLMENVRQILTKNDGFVGNMMIQTMNELGYIMTSSILSSADYGVPQNRLRAFFVGVRNDIPITFSFDNLIKQKEVSVHEALFDLYPLDSIYLPPIYVEDILTYTDCLCPNDYTTYLRNGSLNKIYNHNIKYPNEEIQHRMSYIEEGQNWKSVPQELWKTHRTNRHSSVYRRLKSDSVSITIDGGHMNYIHPKFNRVPTVRESARIQSFPDNFIFTGNQTSQFRQVGNSVPPLLSKAIAMEIKNILDNFESLTDKPY